MTFKLTKPGTNPARQDAPHPHEVILDPTGEFIITPDLGADLLRIFHIDSTTNELVALEPFSVVAGSGPRHGAFLRTDNNTYLYVVTELANTLTGYEVTYGGNNSLGLRPFYESTVFGNVAVPYGAAAAEIHLSVGPRSLSLSLGTFSSSNPVTYTS